MPDNVISQRLLLGLVKFTQPWSVFRLEAGRWSICSCHGCGCSKDRCVHAAWVNYDCIESAAADGWYLFLASDRRIGPFATRELAEEHARNPLPRLLRTVDMTLASYATDVRRQAFLELLIFELETRLAGCPDEANDG
jgi:hypothetical protein